jgi:L-amino acid N-acyltransferase YncA
VTAESHCAPAKVGGHRPPLQEMIIRDGVEADLPAIVEIYNAAILTRISTAQLETVSVEQRLPWFREHSTESYPLWVAEIDGRVAGWLSFHPFLKRDAYRATAEISVYVNEKLRRTGVGSALLEKAIAHSPSLKITALVGCVFAHNKPSLRLFERFGFERWGFLPHIAKVEGIERDLVIVGRPISVEA